MYPDPVQIGPIGIYPVTVALGVGVCLGLWIAIGRARQVGISTAIILKLTVLLLLTGFVGAKAFHAVLHLQDVIHHPIAFLWQGVSGSGVLGAFLLSAPLSYWYLRREKQNAWKVMDVIAPSLIILVVCGRVGCFMAGCCFGKPTTGSLWVVFPSMTPAGDHFPLQPLVPTQLYHALNALLIFALLILWKGLRSYDGRAIATAMFLYSGDRFVVDFYRYYDSSQILWKFGDYTVPTTQVLAFAMMIGSLIFGWRLKTNRQATPTVV